MMRQLIQLSRLFGADHDRVDIARQHARRVGHGFASPELSVGAVEKDRVAAEMTHRHLERHAGPRRRFLEDHRQGLAGERPVAPAVLVSEAKTEDASQCRAVELIEIEKMPRRSGRRALPADYRRFAREAPHVGHSAATLRMTPSASSTSRSPTISGGRMRSTFSPAVRHNRPFWRSLATKSAAGTTQRMPSSRPEPRSSAKSFG